jgi:hypothetical protein
VNQAAKDKVLADLDGSDGRRQHCSQIGCFGAVLAMMMVVKFVGDLGVGFRLYKFAS